MNKRAKAILDFWFIESSPKEKFSRNEKFDKKIKDNFFKDYLQAAENKYDYWQNSSDECLALIILLDQFSRNLFRNNFKAFAMDNKACIIAKKAIDNKYHEKLLIEQIIFIFLPLMHSEKLNNQIHCRKLIDKYLLDDPSYSEIKKFADIHYEIINEFGRFPYRNKVLRRKNTMKENEYLNSTHYGFFNI